MLGRSYFVWNPGLAHSMRRGHDRAEGGKQVRVELPVHLRQHKKSLVSRHWGFVKTFFDQGCIDIADGDQTTSSQG